ncbi:MAG: hypothetical protein ACLFPJ_06235 [Candidatus Woesearchaeota archaeon]
MSNKLNSLKILDNMEINNNKKEILISINPTIFNLEIIILASNSMINNNFFYIDGNSTEEIFIKIIPNNNNNNNLEIIGKKFNNELIVQTKKYFKTKTKKNDYVKIKKRICLPWEDDFKI